MSQRRRQKQDRRAKRKAKRAAGKAEYEQRKLQRVATEDQSDASGHSEADVSGEVVLTDNASATGD